jgi:chromosome segregation ATPase
MRKAFDANVPKLKPRLRTSAPAAPVAEQVTESPLSPTVGEAVLRNPPVSPARGEAAPFRESPLSPTGGEGRVRGQTSLPVEPPRAAAPSVDDRRDRLEKIKRRVAEAARPRAASVVSPADPARAAESVLGLVRELETDLGRARDREEALRADLEASRAEAARAGAEAREAVERLAAAEGQLEEKRGVLTDLLAEMGALETERDEALRRSQALAGLDEERARLLDDVSRRADEEAKLRAEREAEVERLSEELRAGAADGARLRAALSQLARERDDAAGELDRIRRERDELASAKRALEQVHTALAQARARLG